MAMRPPGRRIRSKSARICPRDIPISLTLADFLRHVVGFLVAIPRTGIFGSPEHLAADVSHFRAVVDFVKALLAQVAHRVQRADSIFPVPRYDRLKPRQHAVGVGLAPSAKPTAV